MISIELNKSLFLLFLVVCGNYIGELLGCQTQKILSENILMKHLVLVCLIFFTINLVGDEKKNPIDVLKQTIMLWLFYLILTKMNLYFTFLVLSSLFTLYVVDEYQLYLEEQKIEYNKDYYNYYKEYLKYSIIITAVIGFVYYYYKQKKDHSKNFDHIKFLLGTSQCDFKK